MSDSETTSFKIATWNVNSLRVRLPHVMAWLSTAKPDVLALQETKLPDSDFPYATFQEAGYHVSFSGQRTYNGVAIISRLPLSQTLTDIPGFTDPQRRLLGTTINNIRFFNLYVPNGESLSSEKYQYKLNWLTHLRQFLHLELQKHSQMIIVGDFNIAPYEIDVHNPKRWEGQVLVSDAERDAYQKLLQLGFQDCFRLHATDTKEYSWWDYRLNAFQRNWGLRIDHILASNALSRHCHHCIIDKIPRGWERPSDHTPVIAEFSLPINTA